MLSDIVITTLSSLGATLIHKPSIHPPQPTTEDEFLAIQYEPTDLKISWEAFNTEYQKRQISIGQQRLRSYRDLALAKSDWVMQSDVIHTISNKDDWITYRQALRDLPSSGQPLVWKNGELDIRQMNLPIQPPVIRNESDTV